MPEGDTVFLAGHRLNEALAGKALLRAELRHPRLPSGALSGRSVLGVHTVGKHILMRFSGELSLHSHFRMDGAWHLYRPGQKWQRPAHQVRAIIEVENRIAIGFSLHDMELVPTSAEGSLVGHLGPDLLGAWNATEAVRRLSAEPEVPVFVALLDQRNLAGIGNVYANEVCFLRGVLPTRPIGEVHDLPGTVRLAHRMLEANKDRWTRTTTGDLRPGRQTWVYGRTGRPCRRCGTRLLGGELGKREGEERIVTWCPVCQS